MDNTDSFGGGSIIPTIQAQSGRRTMVIIHVDHVCLVQNARHSNKTLKNILQVVQISNAIFWKGMTQYISGHGIEILASP